MPDTSAPPALAQGKEVAECLHTSHQSPTSYVRAVPYELGGSTGERPTTSRGCVEYVHRLALSGR